jgi:SM-20-related protein
MAGIGNRENLQTIERIRNDHIYWLDPVLANVHETKFLNSIEDFVSHLNRTCYTGITSHEFQYAVYDIGSFFKKHIDQFQNDRSRQFSVVFYLSEKWDNDDGGELLIYTEQGVTKIEPKPGRMVFFRSDLPHEVLTSYHQRLSLTGWMKSI